MIVEVIKDVFKKPKKKVQMTPLVEKITKQEEALQKFIKEEYDK